MDIGAGQGQLSGLLLSRGWRGIGVEVDAASAALARSNNAEAVAAGRYCVEERDWVSGEPNDGMAPVDLIVSSMVLEHLDEPTEAQFFARAVRHLSPAGLCVVLVPANPAAWGIEDDIAGHFRRYTFERFESLLPMLGWRIEHMAGLTYPLSNLLLPVSNALVRRAETDKAALSMTERTHSSGRRGVYGKTIFPRAASLLLNEITLYPLHLVQKIFRRSRSAMVIYLECRPGHT